MSILCELQCNHYYVFQINDRYLNYYPKFVKTYMKSIVGRFERHYGQTYVFNHTVPKVHHLIYKVLSNVAQINFVNYKENPYDLSYHIYKDRLKIVKDITPVVKKAVDKFKYLVVLKQERQERKIYTLWMLTQQGFNRDICEEVIKKI